MTGVFVNYRSVDSRVAAEVISRHLTVAFGSGYVFLDKNVIAPGTPYPQEIRGWIRQRCSVMVAVMGPAWLEAADGGGNRLLFRPRDWVHDEIADALALGLPVVPAPLHDTPLPAATDLPGAIAGLVTREEIRLRDFDQYADLDNLVRCLAALDPALTQGGQQQSQADQPAWAARASWAMRWGAAQLYNTVYSAPIGAALLGLTGALGGTPASAAGVLQEMPDRKAAALLEEMSLARALPILREIPPYKRWEIMTRLPAAVRDGMRTSEQPRIS